MVRLIIELIYMKNALAAGKGVFCVFKSFFRVLSKKPKTDWHKEIVPVFFDITIVSSKVCENFIA